MGTRIKTEKVPYKGWQKRYGRSINMRAPSMFMNSLKIKAENAGGYLFEFPTQTTKLSQVCHICEQAVKKRLSKRWHICCDIRMQRDLYSAFLAKCVDQETSAIDFARTKDLRINDRTAQPKYSIKTKHGWPNIICPGKNNGACLLIITFCQKCRIQVPLHPDTTTDMPSLAKGFLNRLFADMAYLRQFCCLCWKFK